MRSKHKSIVVEVFALCLFSFLRVSHCPSLHNNNSLLIWNPAGTHWTLVSRFISVTVTVYYPSSKIDHFTPLMILLFIQSNSTACSNSMNWYSPFIWHTIKFKITCCAVHFQESFRKCMKGISCCAIVSAPYQEIFFLFFWTKFRELFLKVKLSREVHEWCTSRVQWTSFNFV